MQCAVQWVQQKEGFGNGQHTPSSGWVLYYIATHRACCTSGLNQKQNLKTGTIWKQGGTTLFSFHSVQFGTLSFFWSNGYMKLALQTAVLMTHCCKSQTIELFSLFLHRYSQINTICWNSPKPTAQDPKISKFLTEANLGLIHPSSTEWPLRTHVV